jgi:hypothetical protein
VPIAMTQEQQALQASLRDWAKHTDPIAVVRQGPSTALLADLAALGVFAIPLDGGTVTDLAAALEQLACALTPGPVLPTALASLLLARCGRPDLAGATACVALAPGTLTGTRQADGGLRVTGETGPVLWAAMSTLATERVAMGEGRDEAVQNLLAAGGAVNSDYAERTGVHVAAGRAVALLEERGAHPAIRKLIGTGHRQAVAETALELLGPAGAAATGQPGEASYAFLLTRCLSIAGGTTQILLNQVAERVLGLPR